MYIYNKSGYKNKEMAMNNHRKGPSTPLITHDPYFSLWQAADELYGGPTTHWTGKIQSLNGHIWIDGKAYRFLGDKGARETLEQIGVEIRASSTLYRFAGHGIQLDVLFTSPLLLDDLELLSRPITYLRLRVEVQDGKPHDVDVVIDMDESFCHADDKKQPMLSYTQQNDVLHCVGMGKSIQTPLNHSGDDETIDWGYLYLAVPQSQKSQIYFAADYFSEASKLFPGIEKGNSGYSALFCRLDLGNISQVSEQVVAIAYDDVFSISYFGEARKAYWARNGKTVIEAMEESFHQYSDIIDRCDNLDKEILSRATKAVSEEYGQLCSVAYRQSIAAHKLIADNSGRPIFLSKECFSNGCIGTVDVSYPSVPLFLIFNPALVKAMLLPVIEFAKKPVWPHDFSPHDVGRYPYANGQMYGLKEGFIPGTSGVKRKATVPPLYEFISGSNIYEDEMQMPVEECGNMLIMAAAVVLLGNDRNFAIDNMDLFSKWSEYLILHGRDPGNQLCTDDFAGHLAHNANLAAKAICGIAAYGLLLRTIGREEEADRILETAREMAQDWEERAFVEDHTVLTFGDPESWGQKYNLIWDQIFKTNLFSKTLIEKEIQWYKSHLNPYGFPLDNRKNYTKSDWIAWCASLTDDEADRIALTRPLYNFLINSPDRVPLSDWFETMDGKHLSFRNRSVQGALFMPILKDLVL